MFKVNYLQYLLLLITLFSSFSLAVEECELTPDYLELRKSEGVNIWKFTNQDYKNCVDGERHSAFYRAVYKCRKEGKGENVGGGCFHLAGMGGYEYKRPDVSYCKEFKWSKEARSAYIRKEMDKLVIQKKIVRCK